MFEGFVFIAALAGFEVLASKFGTSSRDSEDWYTHSGPTKVSS